MTGATRPSGQATMAVGKLAGRHGHVPATSCEPVATTAWHPAGPPAERALSARRLSAAKFGATTTVQVAVAVGRDAAPTGFVKLTATSEPDPAKTVMR